MLSKTTGRLLTFCVKWTSFLGGMPYVWDDRRSKIKVCPKTWRKWVFWLVYLAITWAFQIIKFALEFATKSKEKDRDVYYYTKTKEFLYVLVYGIPAVNMGLNTWIHHLEYACFINSYIKFVQHFRNSYVRKLGRGWRNGCEGMLRVVLLWTLVFPILPTIAYFQDPRNPRYITSLLPVLNGYKAIYWTIYILYGTFLAFWVTAATSTITFYAVICILTHSIEFQVVREMIPGQYAYVTKPNLRRPPRVCQVYRSLQVLNTLCNNALAKCMPSMNVSCQFFAIIANCVLIKFWKREKILSSLLLSFPNLYFALWLEAIYLSGTLLKNTQTCIDSWKYLKLKKFGNLIYMRKFRKSCTPLRVRVGNLYFIKPVRLILTVHSVLRTSLKVLIALGKNH